MRKSRLESYLIWRLWDRLRVKHCFVTLPRLKPSPPSRRTWAPLASKCSASHTKCEKWQYSQRRPRMTMFSISREMASKRDSHARKTPQGARLQSVSHWPSPASDCSSNFAKHLSFRLSQLLIELKQEKCRGNEGEFQAICHFSENLRSHRVIRRRAADHGVKFRSFSSLQSKSGESIEVYWPKSCDGASNLSHKH
jgi:hypothetical protein